MTTKVAQTLRKEGVRVMGSNERKYLLDELERIKQDLDPNSKTDETESRPGLLQNRPSMLARKKQIEEMLNKDDDIRAHSGGDRDRLVSEIRKLEDIIKKNRLTAREEALKPGTMDFERAVEKQMYDQKHNGQNIIKWQQLKRMLEPDNPLADDVRLLDA
jgi:hypothetical protein